MSDHAGVTVPLQSPIASKVSDRGGGSARCTQKHVASIYLNKVHNNQFIDNQKTDTLDNVSIHENNNKDRVQGPTLSN